MTAVPTDPRSPFALPAFCRRLAADTAAQSRPLVAPEAAAIYQRLLPQISRIKIFDHHAHPGFAGDEEVDPAPVPDGALPLRLIRGTRTGRRPSRRCSASTSKARLKAQNPGPKYFDAILDKLGIETSIANRITMSADLDPARFKWVFYIDAVLFPFDNSGLAARNTDQAAFMPNQTKLLQRFRQQAGGGRCAGRSRRLSGIRDARARGSPAPRRGRREIRDRLLPFVRRSTIPPRDASSRSTPIPARRRAGAAEYKAFQDFVFRYVVTECGRLHLPVHIHSAAGAGDYFSIARRQRPEPRAGAARSALPGDDLRPDSRRLSVRSAGDLHGDDEERLARLVGDRQLPDVPEPVQGRAEALVRDAARRR